MPKRDLKVSDEVWIADIDNKTVVKGQVISIDNDMSKYNEAGVLGIEFTYDVALPNSKKLRFCYPNNYGDALPRNSIQEATEPLIANLEDHINWYQDRLNTLQATKQRLIDQLEAETNTNKQLELNLGL